MKELKTTWPLIFMAIVFSVTIAISIITRHETYSMEPFMQAAIAVILGGIYMELIKMNKHKTESDKHISEHKHKVIT